MRILITNCTLNLASGTVAYVRDLSIGLIKRGHEVAVYTSFLNTECTALDLEVGLVDKELQLAGVPVIRSLKKMPFTPDIIHGHHTYETTAAKVYFPKTPAIYVCHDRTAPHDRPPHSSAIEIYVAVDENCLERLLFEEKIPKERTLVLYNFVNLNRFIQRSFLPERPQKALIFSNHVNKNTFLPSVQEACDRMEISLDIIGDAIGCYAKKPEDLLGQYDLVFGKAKCALEAMAVGCAVICCDFRGFAGLVTMERYPLMRRYNFGMKTLNRPFEVDVICQEIKKYNAEEAARVSNCVRKEACFENSLDQLENLYKKVVDHAKIKKLDEKMVQKFEKTHQMEHPYLSPS